MVTVHRNREPSGTILDAAVHVFATHGFAAATLEEIARRAGFSHQTVRDRFTDKARLWRAVQHDGWEHLMATVARKVARAGDAQARLRGALDALVQLAQTSCDQLRVLLRCDPAAPGGEGLLDLRQWFASLLADAGCAAPSVYAAMILGAVCGLCGAHHGQTASTAEVLDQLLRHATAS
jgi:AcrR family transcriptional regulator